MADVRSAPDNDQLVDKCAARLKELRLEGAKIALGGDLDWALKAKLGNALPSASWQPGNEIQDQFRLIKDEYELASLRQSQQVSDAEIRAGQKGIRPGRRDWDVLADMVQAGIRQGAAIDSCRHFIGYGPGTDDLWSPPSGRQIKSGEVINFEGIVYCGHYNIETPVTFAVGKVSTKQKEVAGINFDAFQAGVAAMKPGVTVASVVEASSKVLKAHSFDKMIRGFGHFIGLANNDRPNFDNAMKAELALQPGMTLSYHTTITVPSKEAIAVVGSVVLITKDGKELLTKVEPKPMQETA
jgi:Xaa-Pro dipeptidase